MSPEYSLSERWVGGGGYSDALFTADLAEGDDLGIPGEMLLIEVLHCGRVVGGAVASYLRETHGGHLAVFNINIPEPHRRKGLATAIYDKVESVFGEPVRPYPGNEGGAIVDFWMNRLKDDPAALARWMKNIR